MDELVDKEAREMDHKFPGMFNRAQQDEGVILDCYHWFFKVALDAIGIGKGYTIERRNFDLDDKIQAGSDAITVPSTTRSRGSPNALLFGRLMKRKIFLSAPLFIGCAQLHVMTFRATSYSHQVDPLHNSTTISQEDTLHKHQAPGYHGHCQTGARPRIP
jgi:hypothetical protein